MPIKFRCIHCKQFLGISRTRAGVIVDCPTCGRSIRVPSLDGKAAPIPQPKLNLKDTGVERALMELATIGQSDPADDGPETETSSDRPDFSAEPTMTLDPAEPSEPIILDAPQPERVTTIVAPEAGDHSNENDPADIWRDELSVLANLTHADVGFTSAKIARSATIRRALRRGGLGLLIACSMLAAFAMGLRVGSSRTPMGTDPSVLIPQPPEASPVKKDETARERATGGGEPAKLASISGIVGRITYKTPSGECRPDREARVLLFPQSAQQSDDNGSVGSLLSVIGFRATDDDSARNEAVRAMADRKGAFLLTDENGEFACRLPKSGEYRILVLSQTLIRDDNQAIPADLRALIDGLFDRPGQLLGRVRFTFGRVTQPNQAVAIWDHSFEP